MSISFTKVTPIKDVTNTTTNFNGQDITILQYLPIEKKSKLIEQIMSYVFDDTGFASPIRMNIYFTIFTLKAYTDISITEKMIENANKTYDAIILNHLDTLLNFIPENELNDLQEMIEKSIDQVVKYNTSFLGMIRAASADYDATKMNVDELMRTLDQPDKVGLVKDVLDKLG